LGRIACLSAGRLTSIRSSIRVGLGAPIYFLEKMKTHQMKLDPVPFEKISDGSKIVESRLYDKKRQQIDLGDKIQFVRDDDNSKILNTEVEALYRYPDFASMFSDFPPEYFGGNSREWLSKEIEMFYSKVEQAKYGVVGIKIKLLK